ncbi:MAG: TetR/AcrR family transcriptional regulator [Myxococcota bacterium]
MAQQPPSPPPRPANGPAATAAAILKAARAVLAERGPEALSVSEVAHRAGVNRTTAYQHYRTREELIGAVMAELSDEVSLLLTRDVRSGERLGEMVRFFVEHPEISRLWMFQTLHEIPMPHDEGWSRYVRELRRLADSPRTQDGIDPEMLGHVLTAAAHVWSLRVRALAEDDTHVHALTERFIRELTRLMLFGVMRPEAWPAMVASLASNEGSSTFDEEARE